MPRIDSTIVIAASMPRVFDLISRPQEFAGFSQYIVQVVPFGNKKYHWGIENSGSYTLAQTKRGTEVTFEMDYHFPSKTLDALAAPLSEPLLQVAITEVLESIKGRLEKDTETDG
jgi:ribosome-associated toxin RatA of RatAB toxin-antitoxin module